MIIWTVLCSGSAIDRDSNNVSLFNVLEQVTVSPEAEGAVVPIDYEIVMLWQRDEPDRGEEFEASLYLVTPKGEELEASPFSVDLSEVERSRIRLQSSLFPVRGEGRYWFVIRRQGEDVAQVPLTLRYQEMDQ